jgi:dTDP-4-dehydrorhamnose 3,5-epimerase
MKFVPTKLKGLWVVEPDLKRDSRGFFVEMFKQKEFEARGITETFVQDNRSRSVKGTWRGLHYQVPPHGMGKFVFATQGEIFDVAVDIRRGSPSFGQWFGYTLSAETLHAVYVPPGFAHGFCVLSETAEVYYKCTTHYAPTADRAIRWDDPAIGIRLPLQPHLISEKDQKAPLLKDADIPPLF